MKKLTTREIAAIKRQFKNSLPIVKKIDTINHKIEELQKEKTLLEEIFNGGETGIIAMTGGYKSTDLITCTYKLQYNEDGTPKMDKEGKYQTKVQVLTFNEPVEDNTENNEELIKENTEYLNVDSSQEII